MQNQNEEIIKKTLSSPVTPPTETPQDLPEEIQREIQRSIDNLSIASILVAKIAAKRKYFGKTLDEWDEQLSISINPDCNSNQIINYCSQLNTNLGTIYSHLSRSKKMYSDYKLSYIPAYAEGLKNEVSKYAIKDKRPPALDSLKAINEAKLSDRALMSVEFESLIEFWQDMLYKVRNQIDLIKIVGMANGTRARIESGL